MDNVRIVQVKHEPPDDYEIPEMPENESADLVPDEVISRKETSSPSIASVDSDLPKKKKRKVKCDQCNKVYPDKYSLKKHVRTHSTLYPYKCLHCDLSFKIKQYLNKHYSRVHEKKRDHVCKICRKSFYTRNSLSVHSMTHTGERPFKCEICDKGFNRNYTLNLHILIHTGEKPYKCGFCDYSCRDNSTLRKHETRHMGISIEYHCKKCKYRCKAKWMLKQHVLEKHYCMDVRIYKCPQCRAKFKYKAVLKQHIKTVHENIRPFQCDVCKKYISRRSNLLSHMNSHFGEKIFKCEFGDCSKIFKSKADLQKHKIIHFPDDHRECPHCGRRFSRMERLRRHVRVMHGTKKKDTPCDICGVRFYSQSYLAQHMRIVHGTNAVCECDYCGDTYRNKPGLIMHMKYAHRAKYEMDPESQIEQISKNKFECDREIKQEKEELSFETEVDISEIKEELLEVTDREQEEEVDVESLWKEDEVIDTVKIECQDMNQLTYSHDILSEDIAKCIIANERDVENGPEKWISQCYVEHVIGNTDQDPGCTLSTQRTNDLKMEEVLKKVRKRLNAKKKVLRHKFYYMENKEILKKRRKRKKMAGRLLVPKKDNTIMMYNEENNDDHEYLSENTIVNDEENSTKFALEQWKDKIDLNKKLIIKLEDIAKLEGFKMERNNDVNTSTTEKNNPAHEDLKHIEDLLALESVTCINNDKHITKMWQMAEQAKLEGRQISLPCNQCTKVFPLVQSLKTHIKYVHEKYKRKEKSSINNAEYIEKMSQIAKQAKLEGRQIRIRCNQCKKKCCSILSLKMHIKYGHEKYKIKKKQKAPVKLNKTLVERKVVYSQKTVENASVNNTASPENVEIEYEDLKEIEDGLSLNSVTCVNSDEYIVKMTQMAKQAKLEGRQISFPSNQCNSPSNNLENEKNATSINSILEHSEDFFEKYDSENSMESQENVEIDENTISSNLFLDDNEIVDNALKSVTCINSDEYIAKMSQRAKQAKLDGREIKLPCNQCSKVCFAVASLSLHIKYVHDIHEHKKKQETPLRTKKNNYIPKVVDSHETIENASVKNTASPENVEIEYEDLKEIEDVLNLNSVTCVNNDEHIAKMTQMAKQAKFERRQISFPCNQCTKLCYTVDILRTHIKDHHEKYKRKKQEDYINSDEYIAKMSQMAKQAKLEGIQITFPCNQCTKVCSAVQSLRVHIKCIHETYENKNKQDYINNEYIAKMSQRFKQAKLEGRKIELPCNQCTKVCFTVQSLSVHILLIHENKKKKETPVGTKKKNFKPKVIDSQETIETGSVKNTASSENVEMVENINPIVECNKNFFEGDDSINGMASQENVEIEDYTIEDDAVVETKFKTVTSINSNEHIAKMWRMAKNAKVERRKIWFPCNQCDKVCSLVQNLRIHIKNHHENYTTTKEEACIKSDEYIAKISQMAKQAEIEGRQISFPCNQCTKVCSKVQSLRMHMKCVHEKYKRKKKQQAERVVSPKGKCYEPNLADSQETSVNNTASPENVEIEENVPSNIQTLSDGKEIAENRSIPYTYSSTTPLKNVEIEDNATSINPILEHSEDYFEKDDSENSMESQENVEIDENTISSNLLLEDNEIVDNALKSVTCINSDEYIAKMSQRAKQAKLEGRQIKLPCNQCTKVCFAVASLSLHIKYVHDKYKRKKKQKATSWLQSYRKGPTVRLKRKKIERKLVHSEETIDNACVNNKSSPTNVEIEENSTCTNILLEDSEEIVKNASELNTPSSKNVEIVENAQSINSILGDNEIVENRSVFYTFSSTTPPHNLENGENATYINSILEHSDYFFEKGDSVNSMESQENVEIVENAISSNVFSEDNEIVDNALQSVTCINGDEYIAKMSQMAKQAKLEGIQIEFPCNQCTKVYPTFQSLRVHIKCHHEKYKRKKQDCINGDEYIVQMSQMAEQAKLEGRQIRFPCNQCTKVCSAVQNLRMHIICAHKKYKSKKIQKTPCYPTVVRMKRKKIERKMVNSQEIVENAYPTVVRLKRKKIERKMVNSQEIVENACVNETSSTKNVEIGDNATCTNIIFEYIEEIVENASEINAASLKNVEKVENAQCINSILGDTNETIENRSVFYTYSDTAPPNNLENEQIATPINRIVGDSIEIVENRVFYTYSSTAPLTNVEIEDDATFINLECSEEIEDDSVSRMSSQEKKEENATSPNLFPEDNEVVENASVNSTASLENLQIKQKATCSNITLGNDREVEVDEDMGRLILEDDEEIEENASLKNITSINGNIDFKQFLGKYGKINIFDRNNHNRDKINQNPHTTDKNIEIDINFDKSDRLDKIDWNIHKTSQNLGKHDPNTEIQTNKRNEEIGLIRQVSFLDTGRNVGETEMNIDKTNHTNIQKYENVSNNIVHNKTYQNPDKDLLHTDLLHTSKQNEGTTVIGQNLSIEENSSMPLKLNRSHKVPVYTYVKRDKGGLQN